MGLFSTLAGVVDGLLTEAANRQMLPQGSCGVNTVEGLCAQLGWSVDERTGNTAVLHFNDPTAGTRKVSLCPGESGTIRFITTSFASFQALPPSVAEYLLARNAHLEIGGWAVAAVGNGFAVALIHRASLATLTAPAFRVACETMVREVHDLDARLRRSGLLV